MRPPPRRSAAVRLRTGETRIGRLLLPGLVLVFATYVTFQLCQGLAAQAFAAARSAAASGAVGATPFRRDDLGSQAALGGALPSTRTAPAVVKAAAASDDRGTIHVMATSNGSPYLNYQTRIMYKTFTMVQQTAEGRHLKYFTRLLHRRTDDELMAEVPTVRVDSLHASCDKWCEFPVADRPNAVAAWLRTDDAKLGEWIFMIETDYVWMRAPPAPAPGGKPVAFHFHYINPGYPGLGSVISKMWTGPQGEIPCTGPAPVIITHKDLVKLMPKWEEYAAFIESNAEAKEKLGWVREMYAYSIAAAAEGIVHDVQEPSTTVLISQPPADDSLHRASMFHYTWGAQFKNASGGVVWEFDKRPYVDVKHVRRIREHAPSMPPADAAERGLRLQDGKAVTKELLAVEGDMIARMRAAALALPNLPDAPGCGWLDNEPACDFGCRQGVLCVPPGATFALPPK